MLIDYFSLFCAYFWINISCFDFYSFNFFWNRFLLITLALNKWGSFGVVNNWQWAICRIFNCLKLSISNANSIELIPATLVSWLLSQNLPLFVKDILFFWYFLVNCFGIQTAYIKFISSPSWIWFKNVAVCSISVCHLGGIAFWLRMPTVHLPNLFWYMFFYGSFCFRVS